MPKFIPESVVVEAIIENNDKMFTVIFQKGDGEMRTMRAQWTPRNEAERQALREQGIVTLVDAAIGRFRSFSPGRVTRLEFDGYTIFAAD